MVMKFSKCNTILNRFGGLVSIRETTYEFDTADNYCNTPRIVYKVATELLHMNLYSEEYLYLFCFNTKMKLLSIFEVSHGTCDYSLARGREIFQKALIANAANIILVHNHPSGDPEPSECDINLTNNIIKIGKLIDIELNDHIIVGHDSYVSFRKRGLIN